MVTVNDNIKIVFCSYLRQKWIDLRQTKIKMSSGPFYTYLGIQLNSNNVLFCFSDICLLVFLLHTSHTLRSLYTVSQKKSSTSYFAEYFCAGSTDCKNFNGYRVRDNP